VTVSAPSNSNEKYDPAFRRFVPVGLAEKLICGVHAPPDPPTTNIPSIIKWVYATVVAALITLDAIPVTWVVLWAVAIAFTAAVQYRTRYSRRVTVPPKEKANAFVWLVVPVL
jgi:hypothetical protein